MSAAVEAADSGLAVQDLAKLDVHALTPATPEVTRRRAPRHTV